VNWVTKCLTHHRKKSGDELSSQEIELFLEKLSKTKEDWQVQQAALAIRIYQYYAKTRSSPIRYDAIDDKTQWRFVANEMKNMLRLKQRALSTERTYLSWLRQFYIFVSGRSPFNLDSTHVKNFLTHLAVDKRISKSTQNQAFNAILFFFRHVLEKQINDLDDVVRSRRGRRLPVVLTQAEIAKLFAQLKGIYHLMAVIIYGGGLRLRECV
jgi:integrase